MAIILEAAYSKKLGLPNYSSHSYVVSIRTELADLSRVEEESARLYALLQRSVDGQIQEVGFLPDATRYGMDNADAVPQPSSHLPANGNGHQADHPTQHQSGDHWVCSNKQRELILKLVEQHGLDKKQVETLSKEMFGLPVRTLNRLQASGLIEELLERHGKAAKNGNQRCIGLPEAWRAVVSTLVDTLQSPPAEDQIIAKLQQKVSASKLMLFQACRLKFFFRYVLGLRKPKTAALHVGVAVHAVLSHWNRARWRQQLPGLAELHASYREMWQTAQAEEPVAWDNPAVEAEQQQTGWRLLETFFRESPIREAGRPDAVEVMVEADLTSHGLPTLVGVLDLVQNGIVVDFKTSSTTPNPERAALVNATQATAYSMLFRENTGRKEIGIELHHLVKLKQPKLAVVRLPPIGERERSRLLRVIDAYVVGLDRRDFIPSPGLQCAACEFFHECAAWH